MKRTIISCLAMLIAVGATHGRAGAVEGWGPRVGMTVDPDQVHVGAHMSLGYAFDRFRLQPNVELGVGDDMTIMNVNGDLAYLFNVDNDSWRPFLGGGVGLYAIDRQDSRGRDGDSDLEAGLHMIGGIEYALSGGNRFAAEVKLGLVDEPDMKWTAAWTFGR
ncbi:MAG TPA: hypothetical protein VGB22_00655 [candidate division Zixibacteria bacterium]|jgi:opacity protein-like surface antigen